jgi:cytochrome c oxidase subunit IV
MDFSPAMWKSIPGLISDHYKQGNLNWPMIIYISLVHGLALAGLWHTQYASRETLMFAFILWPIRYVVSCTTCTALTALFVVMRRLDLSEYRV